MSVPEVGSLNNHRSFEEGVLAYVIIRSDTDSV